VTLRTTELQQLFRNIDPQLINQPPKHEWDFTNMPKEVRVKTTELQSLLVNIDPGMAMLQKTFWHDSRLCLIS
jgi:hypothetical protein